MLNRSLSTINSPLATSSPKPENKPTRLNSKESIRILNINFQSVRNKKVELLDLLTSSETDIIIGTETWLNDTIYSWSMIMVDLTASNSVSLLLNISELIRVFRTAMRTPPPLDFGCCLMPIQQFFSYIMARIKLIFNEMMMRFFETTVRDRHTCMSPHLDTLS
jgi:hypothetical protein